MNRLRVLFTCPILFSLAYCGATRAQEPEVLADSAPVVIMAPAGPVFVEMRLSVDGKAYRLWVTEFLAGKTDVNRDGRLNLDELKLIPARLMQKTTAKSAKRILRRATEEKDAESITVERFATWFAQELSQSFNVIAGAVQASEAVRLAALVDQNGDGGVTRSELATGSHAMRFRDLDDDQTFSAAELLPYRDPRTQQSAVVPDAADLPFVQLGDDESFQRTAKQIVTRYGVGESVSRETLRLPDSDGLAETLSAKDCETFLRNPQYHIVMNIKLSDRPNASAVSFDIDKAASKFCVAKNEARRARAKLIIDDMPIAVRARGGSVKTRSFLVNFILQRVFVSDADKSGYLSEDEFPAIQQQLAQQGITAQFSDADLNGDEMLFVNELKMFIERDSIATQSSIEVSVRQDGKTLFKLLDANTDRRLSQRELLEGFDVLLEYDVNKDEKLTESELGTAYALEIGLGQVASLRMDSMMQNANMGMRSTDAILPGVSGLEGPEWFRRMDRNQDRDVSLREFLGPHSVFKELDKNSDGLLSASEAETL